MRVYIDVETFSECNLRRAGAFKYAEDPTTMLLCFTLMVNNQERTTINWVEGQSLPAELFEWSRDKDVLFVAHNAPFEISVLHGTAGNAVGFPTIPVNRWRDTSAVARYYSLPASLEGCASALDLNVSKDLKGKNIMMKLAKPRKPSIGNKDIRWTPETKPEDFDHLYRYCEQDVFVTMLLDAVLGDLPGQEQIFWELDYLINSRGYNIDIDTVNHIISLRELIIARNEQQCLDVTGFTSSNRAGIMNWCAGQGVTLQNYTKAHLQDVITRPSTPSAVRRVLEVRLSSGKVSTKKFYALADAVCDDNKLRGSLYYYGASTTGRWAGRIFQPQNITRGSLKNVPTVIKDLYKYDLDSIEFMYGDPMEVFSSCIRAMIQAQAGKEFVVCDYAAIEARVLQWLVEDWKAVDVFTSGLDVYKVMAERIFEVPYELVTDYQRFVGKIAVLGLGYNMGVDTFLLTCHSWGLTSVDYDLAEKTVKAFRTLYSKLKKFWQLANNQAMAAVAAPGSEQKCGRLTFYCSDSYLFMTLPSGRELSYYKPTIKEQTRKIRKRLTCKRTGKKFFTYEDFTTNVIQFLGVDSRTRKWGVISTYGGKTVENATQAIARDLLAEAMLRLENRGFPVILTVHDEIICETEIGALSPRLMESTMCELPGWAAGLPIAAKAFVTNRYCK